MPGFSPVKTTNGIMLISERMNAHMKTNMKWLLVAAVLVSALAATAEAGDQNLFKQLDVDKSDSLSRDELMKSDLVAVPDKDGKKRIQHRDLVKDGQAAPLTADQKHRLFDQIDRDKNGFINRKEWNRASPDGFILWKF